MFFTLSKCWKPTHCCKNGYFCPRGLITFAFLCVLEGLIACSFAFIRFRQHQKMLNALSCSSLVEILSSFPNGLDELMNVQIPRDGDTNEILPLQGTLGVLTTRYIPPGQVDIRLSERQLRQLVLS
jgi:hypothetical protein